ncbi:MAG: glycosyltransferase family 4 protein [Myxococcota bacterium]|nr:glycosyltransferase family 4 protein [Myxococcota bacterium]
MHVLLLALNYYPDKLGNAPLMTGLCEGLVRRGHRVTVVCAFPHHESGRIDAEYRGKLFQRDQHNGVEILRVWLYAPQGGTLAKMANYASFTASAFAAASTIADVDVVFTPSPPLTLGVVDQLISRFRKVPFVYNLQDLFPEAAIRLGVLTNPFVIKGFEALERQVYRKAHHLSVISEGFKAHCVARGVPQAKVTVIPNYTDTSFVTPRAKRGNRYRQAHGLARKFVVQFSGRMGYSQGLDTVVSAWALLKDLPDIRLMLVGEGQARPMLDDALGDDPRVILLPVQPRADLPDLLASADVSLAPLRHGMAGTSVPSKIFGIMASARPVIAGVDHGSDADLLIQRAQCGLVVTPEDASALAAAIRRLYHNRREANAMGRKGRAYAVAHHSQDVVIDQYEAMLNAVIERGRN